MLNVVEILIPIFLLILLGYFLKVLNFPHKDFWNYLDKFNYFILFPSLLVYKLSTADIKGIVSFDFIYITTVCILVLTALLMIVNKIVKFNSAKFTSIYQGAVRFNTYVFLALIDSLYGDEGIVLAALLITFMIPLLNVLCIGSFSLYISEAKVTILSFTKSVFTNPLILACLFGGGLNYLGLSLPSLVLNSMGLLTAAALPLGLLSVGVGLQFSNIIEVKSELLVSTIAKLIIKPIIIFILALPFGVSEMALAVILIFTMMPTAPTSYVLAKQLGGDEKLMSSIISVQTIVSIFTISVFLQLIS